MNLWTALTIADDGPANSQNTVGQRDVRNTGDIHQIHQKNHLHCIHMTRGWHGNRRNVVKHWRLAQWAGASIQTRPCLGARTLADQTLPGRRIVSS